MCLLAFRPLNACARTQTERVDTCGVSSTGFSKLQKLGHSTPDSPRPELEACPLWPPEPLVLGFPRVPRRAQASSPHGRPTRRNVPGARHSSQTRAPRKVTSPRHCACDVSGAPRGSSSSDPCSPVTACASPATLQYQRGAFRGRWHHGPCKSCARPTPSLSPRKPRLL